VLAASVTKALMVEAASTTERQVNFYQYTRRNISEDSRLQVDILFSRFLQQVGLFVILTNASLQIT
jgi:hypothetical protein